MFETTFHAEAKREYFGRLTSQYLTLGTEVTSLKKRDRQKNHNPYVNRNYFVGKGPDTLLHRIAACEVLFELAELPTDGIKDMAANTLRLSDGRRKGGPIIDRLIMDILTFSKAVGNDISIGLPKRVSERVKTAQNNIINALQDKPTLPLNIKADVMQHPDTLSNIVRGYFIYRYLASKNGHSERPNKTQLWYHFISNPQASESINAEAYMGSMFLFYHTPPVEISDIPIRNSILFVGSKPQNWDLEEHLASLGQEQALTSDKIEYGVTSGIFWRNFFGQEMFLDTDQISKPAGIYTTGIMRAYDGKYGMTIPVEDRLREIADHFGIPIRVFSERLKLS